MKPKKLLDKNDIEEEIISAAYGDSGWYKSLRIKKLIKQDSGLKALYEKHKKTADQVHSLKREECPEFIVTSAFNKVKRSGYKEQYFYLKPAFSAALLVILIIISILIFLPETEENQKIYTREEIINAEKQAKESLALIGRILNKASDTLEEEILPKHVSKPVKKSLNIIQNLIGG